MPSRPFPWDDASAKFHQLTAGRIDGELAKEIKEAVRSLDQIQVKDLTALLARVRVSNTRQPPSGANRLALESQ
jgi:2-methylcitrate dehydratase